MEIKKGTQLVSGVLLALVLTGSARAQDVIRYSDHKTTKEVAATGTIEAESPAAVVYKPGTSALTKEIPALDIIDVTYDVPAGIKLTYRSAVADEKRAADPSAKDTE